MSEAIAFFGGLIAMAIVWFVYDTKYNPYMRGYAEGLNDGIQEAVGAERKKRIGGNYYCYKCGAEIHPFELMGEWRYCPNCGEATIWVGDEEGIKGAEQIKELPPAQPKRGEWIYHIDDLFPAESTMECNQCHAEQPLTCDDEFCPHCGAEMEG